MSALLQTEPRALAARRISPGDLGSKTFRERHRLKFAYVAGAMYKGIASKELVIRMGKAGLLGYLGSGGLKLDQLENDLAKIKSELQNGEVFGSNLLSSPFNPELERATVDLLLKHDIRRIEAAAFTHVTPEIVRYRAKGLVKHPDGEVVSQHFVLAKVSRPEVAEHFLSPPPAEILQKLAANGAITAEEATLARSFPMADDLCVEADSGGHTDRGVAHALVPAILQLRDHLCEKFQYSHPICVGAAGGLGTPHALAASFILGADFVLTGSINQCTVEAGTSDAVKDMLQEAKVQDTDIVPAGDMFETGAKVQVFRKGLLFPARAKKLYELYRQYDCLEAIDPKTKEQIETRYFKRTFSEVYAETKAFYLKTMPQVIERAERDPKQKMALVFRWYFVHTGRLALQGNLENKVDYQIHCGPALGAFNQWVQGTRFADWRNRHVDEIADHLMNSTAELLQSRILQFYPSQ
jgi:trans-AT polyketide synthase/acyltransferase/oxidoreductase domain-containing protein